MTVKRGEEKSDSLNVEQLAVRHQDPGRPLASMCQNSESQTLKLHQTTVGPRHCRWMLRDKDADMLKQKAYGGLMGNSVATPTHQPSTKHSSFPGSSPR